MKVKRQRMAALKDGLMVQEIFRRDPWKLLVGCMMLNQTTGVQVHRVIYEFFDRYPNSVSASRANKNEMKRLIKPLGLQRRRADLIKRFSGEYLGKDWRRPSELTGIGKYAEDSWDIFIDGRLNVKPDDKELKAYLKRIKNGSRRD